MNALKSGLFSKKALLPDESAEQFRQLHAALYAEWLPKGPSEECLVERLGALLWRQGRVYRGEAGLYGIFRQCPEGLGGVGTALAKDGTETEAFSRLIRMDSALERSVQLTIRLLQKLQAERADRAGLTIPAPTPPF